MVITLSLFIICVILYTIKRRRDVNYWEQRGVPFVKPLPFIGNPVGSLLLGKSITAVMKEVYFKLDERFYGSWFFNRPQLIIRCPDLIKQIFIRDFKYFQDRNITLDEKFDDFSANMIFFMKHPKSELFRSKTTKIFSAKRIKNMYPQMQIVTRNLIDFINSDSNSRSVELSDIFAKYVTQMAFSIAFGVDSKSFQNIDTPFVSIGKNTFMVTISHMLSMLLHHCGYSLASIFKLKMAKSATATFLKEFFIDVIEERESQSYYREDFIDFLIKFRNESNLSDNEIAAQAAQFLVAGFEGANSAIALALYELALNKCIQNKLREEILVNLDSDGDLSYELLNAMDYLDKVVYETFRKYPIFPMIGRTCTKDYKVPNSALVIEKGIAVIVPLSGLHHDPKYYPDPETFEPERFSLENVRRRHPCSFLPFGEGQRSCIGRRLGLLVVKLGIAYVIKTYEVDICKETIVPLEFSPKKFNLSASHGIYVQFTRVD